MPEELPPPPAVTTITVPLIEKAADSLVMIAVRTGLSRTDVLNRALSVYEFIDSEMSSGAEIIVRHGDTDHLVALF